MALPTLDQTEGIWITRTENNGYHYVQEVFKGEMPRERFHRANCQLLIRRGSLEPESFDGLAPGQRIWNATLRYCRVHT